MALNDIRSAIQAAEQAAIHTVWGGFQPQYSDIIHDGDGVRRDGTPYGEECKGCWVINASTTQKPQVVHQSNLSTELAPQDIYSGMYGRVTIRFYGYNNGQKGVACGLGNIMKTRDGEALGGGSTAAQDFAGLESTPAQVGAVPQQAPAQPNGFTAPPQQYGAPQPAAYPTQAFPQGQPVAMPNGQPVQYPAYPQQG